MHVNFKYKKIIHLLIYFSIFQNMIRVVIRQIINNIFYILFCIIEHFICNIIMSENIIQLFNEMKIYKITYQMETNLNNK